MRFSRTDSRGKPRAIWNVRTRPRRVIPPARDVLAVEDDGAGLGRQEPRDAVEEGGLAGAVRADEAGDRPPLDREVHSVQRAHAVEAARETADREEGRHGPTLP